MEINLNKIYFIPNHTNNGKIFRDNREILSLSKNGNYDLLVFDNTEIKHNDLFFGHGMIKPERAVNFENNLINGFAKNELKKIVACSNPEYLKLTFKFNPLCDFTLEQMSETNIVVLLSDIDILKVLSNIYHLY
jgi:hypothetical protein